MSKRTRTLLISTVALVVLAALLTVLLLLPAPAEDGDDVTPDTSVSLVAKKDAVTVTKITVTTPSESFRVESDKNGEFAITDYADLPQQPYAYDLLAENLLSITASRLIADTPEHPQDFGFDKTEACTAAVEVTYSDKTSFGFELGDLSPSGEGYYLRRSDSSAIYLVDASFGETVAQPSTAYLLTAPMTAPTTDEQNETAVVRDVKLFGTVRKEPLLFQVSDQVTTESTQALTGYVVTKPYYRNLKSGTGLLDTAVYSGFTATRVVKVRPTAADLKHYGLANPYSACTVTLAIKKATTEGVGDDKTTTLSYHSALEYTVKLGNDAGNGERYAVVYADDELVPLLYTVPTAEVAWANTQYDDVADSLLFFTYIDTVETLSVTLDGVTTSFALTHTPKAEERDDQLTAIANGKKYDTADFRTLYGALMNIMRSGAADKAPTGQPVMSITIRTNTDTARGSDVRLYRYSAGKYTVQHDTGETYLVDAKDVEKTMALYRQFLNGESLD